MAKKRGITGSISAFFGRLFCRRNIIVVAEHKTGHIPLSLSTQLTVVFLVLGVVSWVSYSTGSYMEAQSVIAEKDRKIANTKQENSRIESEFNLLKRDLAKLVDEESSGDDVSEYAKFMIDQYNDNESTFVGPPVRPAGLYDEEERKVASKLIFERVTYLEQVMEDQRDHYNQLMREIEQVTGQKIDELQKVIRTSGLDIQRMARRAEKEARENNENPSGGPYEPLEDSLLAEEYGELHKDLNRMNVLLKVTEHMPLVRPMDDARVTSSFGTRRDPFTGRRAHHGGMDFVNREDRSIYATADGTVSYAGKRGAYGNLVEIDHGLGITTRFGHLAKMHVEKGQKVYKGQLIAVMGNTGRSTGAHLHYEVRLDKKTLNPYHFLKAGKYVQQKENKDD